MYVIKISAMRELHKYLLSALFCGILVVFSYALVHAQTKDFQILIGLNMNDCINCYNNGLNKIEEKANNVDVFLILSERYEKDSTKLIKKYNLRGITKNIVWSDSLLNWLTHGGRSVIAFTSKYRNQLFRFDLEGLPDYMFDYLQRAGKPIDTLFPAYPDVALGTSILNPFFVHENIVYFMDQVVDEIKGYDLFSGKESMRFSIPEDILEKTFAYSGIPAEQYEEQHQILQRAHMASFEIDNIVFNRDTMGVFFTNYYFTIEKDSTLHRDNVNFLKVVDQKVVATNHFPISFKNAMDGNKNYWLRIDYAYCHDGNLYSFMYSMPEKGQDYDYYVIGEFKPNAKGVYSLDKLNPKKNLSVYRQSMSCRSPNYNQDYFAFPLIDTLYSLSGDNEPIPLNIIPEQYQFKTAPERCNDGIFIDGFYVTDDYVWVAYSDNTKNYETVARHDRRTGENVVSENAIKFVSGGIFTRFDPVNPDYLLFALPNKNSILYRAKML